MGPNAQELRELLKLAKKLRQSAWVPENAAYNALFLKSADALEARAYRLAFGTAQPEPEPEPEPVHFDLVC
jgi:hypothetical protein